MTKKTLSNTLLFNTFVPIHKNDLLSELPGLPVTSPFVDDQLTAASSRASSSGDTKSSTKTKPFGKGSGDGSSHVTAEENVNLANVLMHV